MDFLKDSSYESGVLTKACPGAVLPPEELWKGKKNGFVVIECPQRIPCNPCNTSCPTGAVVPFDDINDVPRIDYDKCTGCALCVAKCPGLACFVIDLTFAEGKALIKMPHEMLPVPGVGDEVDCLNRTGDPVGRGRVESVTEPLKDRTRVVSVSVPKELISEVRAVRGVAKMTEKSVCRCCGEGEFDTAKIAKMEDETVLCRCEEVTMGEVRKWIAEGYDTFDELKRMLRVGMGPCQGRGCRDIVLREISRMTGVPIGKIPPGTIRPPVKPIKIALTARDYAGGVPK